jgi:hypothetical protein
MTNTLSKEKEPLTIYITHTEARAIKLASQLSGLSMSTWCRLRLGENAHAALKLEAGKDSVVIGGIGDKIVKVEPDESLIHQYRDGKGRFVKRSK